MSGLPRKNWKKMIENGVSEVRKAVFFRFSRFFSPTITLKFLIFALLFAIFEAYFQIFKANYGLQLTTFWVQNDHFEGSK